jgi:hypothetical protein
MTQNEESSCNLKRVLCKFSYRELVCFYETHFGHCDFHPIEILALQIFAIYMTEDEWSDYVLEAKECIVAVSQVDARLIKQAQAENKRPVARPVKTPNHIGFIEPLIEINAMSSTQPLKGYLDPFPQAKKTVWVTAPILPILNHLKPLMDRFKPVSI